MPQIHMLLQRPDTVKDPPPDEAPEKIETLEADKKIIKVVARPGYAERCTLVGDECGGGGGV